jgi:hypothetical protein
MQHLKHISVAKASTNQNEGGIFQLDVLIWLGSIVAFWKRW